MKNRVSVVIPTFNGLSLLKKHLPSVLSAMRKDDELIIVDDAGTDKSQNWLTKQFKLIRSQDNSESTLYIGTSKQNKIKLLKLKQNKRFGMAANLGIQTAENNQIFLINNDVSPHKYCLRHLVKHFSSKKVFGVGCLEFESHHKNQLAGKNKLWFDRGLFIHSKADNFKSGPTAWVSGGSGMYDRKKWLKLNGFDSRFYPAYWEDIDISHQARKKGWKVLFEAQAKVDHDHESTNKNVFSEIKMIKISWRGADRFTWKHGDFWQKISFLLWRPYWWWQRSKTLKILSQENS